MVRKILQRYTMIISSLILIGGISYINSQLVSAATRSNSTLKNTVISRKNLESRNRDDNTAKSNSSNSSYNSTIPTSNTPQSNIEKILSPTITFPQTPTKIFFFATKLPQTGLQKSEVSLLGIIVLILTSIVGYHGFFKKNNRK